MAAGLHRDSYVPVGRVFHSDVVVEEKLYSWGGKRKGAADVRDCKNEDKMRMTSTIDVFDCKSGNWDFVHTNASSDNERPLGIQGYSAAVIGKHIYYVGGSCGHGTCYHNSIHSLCVDTMEWKCVSPSSDHVPMLKKAYFQLVPFDGELLLAVGGFGRHKHASLLEEKYKYEEDSSHYVFTNEHSMFNISSYADKWTSPDVMGNVPPPIAEFSLDMISSKKAVLFGGTTKDHRSCSDLRVATIARDSVYWELVRTVGVEKPRSGLDMVTGLFGSQPKEEKPKPRRRHASTCLFPSMDYQQVTLLVIGGDDNGTISDCWLLDIAGKKWRSLSLPEWIMKRRDHFISVIASTGGHVWIMVVGGDTNSTFSTPVTAMLELFAGQWEMKMVMNELEIYQGYEQKYSERFSRSRETPLAEKERQVEKLQQQLTGVQTEKNQLELALKKSKDKLQMVSNALQERDSQLSQLQQDVKLSSGKITELELHLKKSDDEMQMVKKMSRVKDSELDRLQLRVRTIEEDKQELEQANKTANVKISELEADIQRLLEKVKEKKTALTQDSATQANYLSVSGESVRGVEECGETVLEITGSKHQKVSWKDYGFHVTVPDGAVSTGITVSLAVKAILAGQFKLPNDAHLVSAIYWVSASEKFHKEVSVHIHHCAIITSEEETSNYKFIVGKCSQESLPYTFKILDGVFSPQSQLATISVKQFSFFGAIFQGLLGNSKRRYTSLCYFKRDLERASWDFRFLVTINLLPCLQVFEQKYEDWTLHHMAEVEFEEGAASRSITLQIADPEKGESEIWDIYPVTPLEIYKECVDESSKDVDIAMPSISCHLAVDWKGLERAILPIFKRRINLVGAKAPKNFFFLHIRPPQSSTAAATSTTSAADIELDCEDICDQVASDMIHRLADRLHKVKLISKDTCQAVKRDVPSAPYARASQMMEPAIECAKRNPRDHEILVTVLRKFNIRLK